MDALGAYSSLLATFGIIAASYLTFKFLKDIWNGLRVYVFTRSRDLKKLGEWAVVTGSTDGIGKGYAHELARKGLNIFLISRSPEKLNDVAQEIESKYKVKTKIMAIDFSKGADIYEAIRHQLVGMDIGILVNNVGVSLEHPQYYAQVNDEVILRILNVNMNSVAMMTKLILPAMAEKKKGAVINIASAAALFPVALLAPYSASKAFVDYLSGALQQEYASRGVIIQCVMPFFVATKLSRIRRSSFFIPDPNSYARQALATVGVQSRTHGCMSHAIQGWVLSHIPLSLVKKLSTGVLKSAITKLLAREERHRKRIATKME